MLHPKVTEALLPLQQRARLTNEGNIAVQSHLARAEGFRQRYPSWAKDPSVAAQMINARSETAGTKPAFRDPLANRRCLIPADGFYEWQRSGKAKQAYCFEVNDGELFAFAGLWDRWKDPSGQWVKSCSILTTTPNAVTLPVHDRMPVILDRDNYDLWLDPGLMNVEAVSDLLKPYDARKMLSYPVNPRVNRRRDGFDKGWHFDNTAQRSRFKTTLL